MATGIKISGLPYPFALNTGTPNGSEVIPADQTNSGVLSTFGMTTAQLFGASTNGLTYPTGGISLSYSSTGAAVSITQTSTGGALTVAGGAFTSRGILDNATANSLTIASTGAVTINAPSSGSTTLEVNSANGYAGIDINSVSGAAYQSWSDGGTTYGYIGLGIVIGVPANDLVIRSNAQNIRFSVDNGNSTTMEIASNGAVSIAAPSSGIALNVNGAANSPATYIKGSATSGQSYGLQVLAGTTSADQVVGFYNQAGTTLWAQINGIGNFVIGPPTSGTTMVLKTASSAFALDLQAPAANTQVYLQGSNLGGGTATGYLGFIPGTGGIGGATETYLENVASTANDYLSFITGGTRRIQINGGGAVVINAPGGGQQALQVSSAVNSRTILAQLAATGSASIAFSAASSGSTGNTLLEVQGTTFSTTGTAAAVLTANKPGTGTAVTTWLKCTVNGTTGWIPFWAN
jgi:hypothetical protein